MTKTTLAELIHLPNKALRQPSKKINHINIEVRRVVEDMQSATLSWEDSREHEAGVALAAVQINKLFRIVVIRNTFDDKNDRSFSVFINPKIVKTSGPVQEDFEGCLSIKEVYGKVPRYERVKIKALDLDGRPVELSTKGFLARVFQHEIDHTNGVLFIDHIKDTPEAFFKLTKDGKLRSLNYEKHIKNNEALW